MLSLATGIYIHWSKEQTIRRPRAGAGFHRYCWDRSKWSFHENEQESNHDGRKREFSSLRRRGWGSDHQKVQSIGIIGRTFPLLAAMEMVYLVDGGGGWPGQSLGDGHWGNVRARGVVGTIGQEGTCQPSAWTAEDNTGRMWGRGSWTLGSGRPGVDPMGPTT